MPVIATYHYLTHRYAICSVLYLLRLFTSAIRLFYAAMREARPAAQMPATQCRREAQQSARGHSERFRRGVSAKARSRSQKAPSCDTRSAAAHVEWCASAMSLMRDIGAARALSRAMIITEALIMRQHALLIYTLSRYARTKGECNKQQMISRLPFPHR